MPDMPKPDSPKPDLPAKKYFTVEEANQTLPLVRAIVADIVRQYGEIKERKDRLEQLQKSKRAPQRESDSFYSDELAHIEEELEREWETLQGYIKELEKIGVELKDLSIGLIDFRARVEGREVYLCWKLGEDEVAHWHELEAGFQGRQSLFAGSMEGRTPTDEPQHPGNQ